MSLNITGYISQDSINLKELEKEIKDFFNYEGEIISRKSGEAILLSNFIQNNEFVCYFVNREGFWELENKNNVKYNYTYKINIDFVINKIKKDGSYNSNIHNNQKQILEFFQMLSQKYKCDILLQLYDDDPQYIIKNGKITKLLDKNKDIGKSNEKTKEIIIKDKLHIGNIVLVVFLLIISIAGFSGYFGQNEEKSIGALLVGILFGLLFLLLFPYVTFKRDYLKINGQGISFKRSLGFTYGKETFIAWNRIEALIGPDIVVTINGKKFQENELNAESISKLDKFNGFTSDDYEDEAEWLENSMYLSTKKENNLEPEIYEIGSMLGNYKKDIETIKECWIEHI